MDARGPNPVRGALKSGPRPGTEKIYLKYVGEIMVLGRNHRKKERKRQNAEKYYPSVEMINTLHCGISITSTLRIQVHVFHANVDCARNGHG